MKGRPVKCDTHWGSDLEKVSSPNVLRYAATFLLNFSHSVKIKSSISFLSPGFSVYRGVTIFHKPPEGDRREVDRMDSPILL